MNDLKIPTKEQRIEKKIHKMINKCKKLEKSKDKLNSKQETLKNKIQRIKNDQSYLKSQGKEVIAKVSKLTDQYNALKEKEANGSLSRKERKQMKKLYKEIIELSYSKEDVKELSKLEKSYTKLGREIMDIQAALDYYEEIATEHGHKIEHAVEHHHDHSHEHVHEHDDHLSIDSSITPRIENIDTNGLTDSFNSHVDTSDDMLDLDDNNKPTTTKKNDGPELGK